MYLDDGQVQSRHEGDEGNEYKAETWDDVLRDCGSNVLICQSALVKVSFEFLFMFFSLVTLVFAYWHVQVVIQELGFCRWLSAVRSLISCLPSSTSSSGLFVKIILGIWDFRFVSSTDPGPLMMLGYKWTVFGFNDLWRVLGQHVCGMDSQTQVIA